MSIFDWDKKNEVLPEVNTGAENKEDAMDMDYCEHTEQRETYDGISFKELYPENHSNDWDHSRGSVRNLPTRMYLQRVRETHRAIELLKRRVKFREDAGEDASDLKQLIEDKAEALKAITAETAEEISKIGNVSQEMVLVKRYIDLMTWDEIAESMDIRIQTVLKFHGYGLVHMSRVLLDDGLIGEDGDEESTPEV